MTLLSILVIGFLLGARHALESDHLAAVATLAVGRQSLVATIRQGVAWGVGHTVTLILIGGLVLMLGTRIPATLEQVLELCVGVMLVGLGADVIRRVVRERIHFHVHRHADGEVHVHAHSHAGPPALSQSGTLLPNLASIDVRQLPVLELKHAWLTHEHSHARRLPLRALAVGMMHGLAGSAALVMLSLQTVQSVPAGLGYILAFGAGSVAGMAVLSLVIAVPLRLSGHYLTSVYRLATVGIGVVTVGLGGWVVYTIGFARGLLTG